MFFDSCIDESTRYEDWQGERDRRVHNFPWAKNFCYISTNFGNEFRREKANDSLDVEQLQKFLDDLLKPKF